jgi:hypothetical protein
MDVGKLKESAMAKLVATADKNGDGKITVEDFTVAWNEAQSELEAKSKISPVKYMYGGLLVGFLAGCAFGMVVLARMF